MSVGEYENEPVHGLPDYLPPDETLIWQGAPDLRTMARRVFHLRSLSIYFGALTLVHLAFQLNKTASVTDALLGASWMLGLGVSAIAILAVMAWAYARTTIYTLTDKRLVLRFGVAIPMMVNLPLSVITAADLRKFKDGSGDVVFTVEPKKRLSYMMMWPNVRPWKFQPMQPALRSLANVDDVVAALASVVASAPAQAANRNAKTANRSAVSGSMLGVS